MATARLLSAKLQILGRLAMLMVVACAGHVWAQDDNTPLQVSTQPYRGRVIDEKTGQPLPTAAVIILWQRLDDQIQGLRRLAGAREVFTNERGEFVHDVAAVEGRFPPKTFAPRILIFRPGYASLPAKPQLFPPGVAASRFTGADVEVRLLPLTDYEDRAEAFNTFIGC